jgi:FixJ family two-component response regulator
MVPEKPASGSFAPSQSSKMTTLEPRDKETPELFVAVVDDDLSFRRSVQRVLSAAGYRVSAFASPSDFLRSLASSVPSCLVVDLHMPGMTGIELYDRLVAQGFSLPAILVTGKETPQTREQARHRGFSGFMPKPCDVQILLQTIEVLCMTPLADFANGAG